jgi:hypothetical protein
MGALKHTREENRDMSKAYETWQVCDTIYKRQTRFSPLIYPQMRPLASTETKEQSMKMKRTINVVSMQ